MDLRLTFYSYLKITALLGSLSFSLFLLFPANPIDLGFEEGAVSGPGPVPMAVPAESPRAEAKGSRRLEAGRALGEAQPSRAGSLIAPESFLAEAVRVSPMWEATVTEIVDYRLEAAGPGKHEVDVVFSAEEHTMPVRMAGTLVEDSRGTWTVQWRGTYHAGEAIALVEAEGVEAMRAAGILLGYIEEFGVARLALPGIGIEEADRAVEYLGALPGVELATLHDLIFPAAAPNDPNYSSQANLKRIDPEFAWSLMPQGAIRPSGEVMTITAVDNGHDINDRDLFSWVNEGEVLDGTDTDGNSWIDDTHGWHFGTGTNFVNTKSSHGSQVARIAGALNNNGIGGASPAAYVRVMPAVYSSSGSGLLFDAVDSARYGILNGAQVINCSFVGGGGSVWNSLFRSVIRHEYNVLFVAAAGNANQNLAEFPVYPAASEEPNVISVGSSTTSDTKVGSSSYSDQYLDLFAPGGATSWSTPLVSSAAALLFAVREDVTWTEVRDWLLEGVDVFTALKPYSITGGRLNLSRSVSLAMGVTYGEAPAPAPEPEPEPVAPGAPSLTASVSGATKATLTIDPRGSGSLDALEVDFRAGNDAFARLTAFSSDGTGEETVVAENLLPGARYGFRARARLGDLTGSWSTVAEVTMPEAAEPPPPEDPEDELFSSLEPVAMARWVDTADFLIGVSADNESRGEGLAELVDNRETTKWLAFERETVFELEFHGLEGREIRAIRLVSGNDRPERDPSHLEFISHATGERIFVSVPEFSQRRQTIEIALDPRLTENRWRMVMRNTSGDITQLSELSFVISETGAFSGLQAWLISEGYASDTDPASVSPRWGGIPLGLVYAFGLYMQGSSGTLEPASVGTNSPRLPQMEMGEDASAHYVFWRNKDMADAVLHLEGSANLRDWGILAEFLPGAAAPKKEGLFAEARGDDLEKIGWTVDPSAQLRYFRVRVHFGN